MSRKLIETFDMKLATPDCFPGAGWYRVLVNLHTSLTLILPYLNAELKGADYNHKTKILLWNKDNKKYAFRPHEIVIAPAENREEAKKLVDNIIHTINNIWLRKDGITPNLETKKPLPKVLDLYKLLPGKNCKECGFLSCMAFATILREDSTKLSLCPYVSKNILM